MIHVQFVNHHSHTPKLNWSLFCWFYWSLDPAKSCKSTTHSFKTDQLLMCIQAYLHTYFLPFPCTAVTANGAGVQLQCCAHFLLSTGPFLKLHLLTRVQNWDQWSETGITESKSFISFGIICSPENPAETWVLDSRWVCSISYYKIHLSLVKWIYLICNLMKDKHRTPYYCNSYLD